MQFDAHISSTHRSRNKAENQQQTSGIMLTDLCLFDIKWAKIANHLEIFTLPRASMEQ